MLQIYLTFCFKTFFKSGKDCPAETCHDCTTAFEVKLRERTQSCGCDTNTLLENQQICGFRGTQVPGIFDLEKNLRFYPPNREMRYRESNHWFKNI